MNTDTLISGLDALIAKKDGSEKVIAQLAKQVWQIDFTVSTYEIVNHYLMFDIPFFYHFMKMDVGDEAEEHQILMDWVGSRDHLDKDGKKALPALIAEINEIKGNARKA